MLYEKLGCTKIFTDMASGIKTERQGLEEALSFLRPGDSLVVWRLDRLGRSLKHLIEVVTDLEKRGKLIFHIFGALAEFERNLIRERTQAGLQAARSRGRLGGRPKAKTLNTLKKVAMAQSLYDNKSNTIDEICKTLNISRATLYRYIKTVGQKP